MKLYTKRRQTGARTPSPVRSDALSLPHNALYPLTPHPRLSRTRTLTSPGCNALTSVKLQCPNLLDSKIPPLQTQPEHVKPQHPPIASLLRENLTAAAHKAAADKEAGIPRDAPVDSIIPHTFRPF